MVLDIPLEEGSSVIERNKFNEGTSIAIVADINERDMIIEGDSTFVETKVGDQEFVKHLIETGLSDGIMIEVLSGVDTTTQIKVIQD